jgi:RNA polymerase sigma-70 factor (ECF subfamily)
MEAVFLNRPGYRYTTHRPVTSPTPLDSFLATVQRKAYHVAYGALWDEELALDVVQETMLRFVEYYRDKPDGEWPALFRSVLNSKVNDQRRRRLLANTKRKLLSLTGMHLADADQDEQMAEADLPAGHHDDGSTDPEAHTAGSQLKHRIEAALATLAERQRQVFLLREQMGLSISEAAETLGCSENSIKQHHFRALRAMRRLLSEVWDHEQG